MSSMPLFVHTAEKAVLNGFKSFNYTKWGRDLNGIFSKTSHTIYCASKEDAEFILNSWNEVEKRTMKKCVMDGGTMWEYTLGTELCKY